MDSFFPVALYSFGFVGLLAFTILPIRIWQLVIHKELYLIIIASKTLAFFGIVTGAFISVAIYLWGSTLYRLSICLTQGFCGANRATGLILLAIFGGYYLIFEGWLGLTRFWHSRHARNLTSHPSRPAKAGG